jgi:hypothetical protein
MLHGANETYMNRWRQGINAALTDDKRGNNINIRNGASAAERSGSAAAECRPPEPVVSLLFFIRLGAHEEDVYATIR